MTTSPTSYDGYTKATPVAAATATAQYNTKHEEYRTFFLDGTLLGVEHAWGAYTHSPQSYPPPPPPLPHRPAGLLGGAWRAVCAVHAVRAVFILSQPTQGTGLLLETLQTCHPCSARSSAILLLIEIKYYQRCVYVRMHSVAS